MANAGSTTTYGPCEFVMDYRSLGRRVVAGSGLCLEFRSTSS